MSETKSVASLMALCLLSAALCHAGGTSPLAAALASGKKQVVVAYGTSLTAQGAWVKQLEASLNTRYPGLATVVNSGASGMWSKWGVDNFEERVLRKKPDALFIEFGINDSVARFDCSVEMSKANLENMIGRMLKSNPACEIILMTTTPGDKYPEGHPSYRKNIAAYYDMYRAVAKARNLLLIDHYAKWKTLQLKDRTLFAEYVPDTIHPSPAGCSKVVTPTILEALGITN
jgi:lysophospholipase L1-like esterase